MKANTGSESASAPKMESPVVEKPSTKVEKPKGPDSDGWYTPDNMDYTNMLGNDYYTQAGELLRKDKGNTRFFATDITSKENQKVFPGSVLNGEDAFLWGEKFRSSHLFSVTGKGSKARFRPAELYHNQATGSLGIHQPGVIEFFD